MSLGAATKIFKESKQNNRILQDMIKEATNFDNSLKKVGLKIDLKKLINDKDDQDPRNRDISISDDSENERAEKRVTLEFPDVIDSDEELDYSLFGKADFTESSKM